MRAAAGAWSLSRKAGWRAFVDTQPRTRPPLLTLRQLEVLPELERIAFDEARHDWHANFGIVATPQLVAIRKGLELIVASNRQDGDRVRGAAVIDGLPGLGKTTIANLFARDFDRAQMAAFGPVTETGNERIPVLHIGLTSNTTLRTLNRMICEFYGHPASRRASSSQLGSFAVDCVLSCSTRLAVIDDVHFVDQHRLDGVAVSNHFKWLANELPVTFVFAGVGLAERRFFAEGLTGSSAAMAQTARRWTRLAVVPFGRGDATGRRDWVSLLAAIEGRLVLARTTPGMLTGLADYLFARTGGNIGSLVTLILRGCFLAIATGEELLGEHLLEQVRIDEAAEAGRRWPLKAAS